MENLLCYLFHLVEMLFHASFHWSGALGIFDRCLRRICRDAPELPRPRSSCIVDGLQLQKYVSHAQIEARRQDCTYVLRLIEVYKKNNDVEKEGRNIYEAIQRTTISAVNAVAVSVFLHVVQKGDPRITDESRY